MTSLLPAVVGEEAKCIPPPRARLWPRPSSGGGWGGGCWWICSCGDSGFGGGRGTDCGDWTWASAGVGTGGDCPWAPAPAAGACPGMRAGGRRIFPAGEAAAAAAEAPAAARGSWTLGGRVRLAATAPVVAPAAPLALLPPTGLARATAPCCSSFRLACCSSAAGAAAVVTCFARPALAWTPCGLASL